MRTRVQAYFLAVLTAVVAAACSSNSSDPADPAYLESVNAWRAKHEADYRRDWSTLAGLHVLNPGPNTAGSAPGNDIALPAGVPPRVGRFIVDGDQVLRVRFEPQAGVSIRLRDQPVTGTIEVRDDARPGGGDELLIDDVRLLTHMSGGRLMLRVRDPDGKLAREFRGFAWFPIDSSYRVTGRFIKDRKTRLMQVVNTFGDLDTFESEGVVEFTLMDRTLRLRPFTTRPTRFYFVFRDASSGEETYQTARFLYSDLKPDGTTVLDFNQAYNPPCSFNPYTTCPIPLKENNVSVKVLAGEKAYAH